MFDRFSYGHLSFTIVVDNFITYIYRFIRSTRRALSTPTFIVHKSHYIIIQLSCQIQEKFYDFYYINYLSLLITVNPTFYSSQKPGKMQMKNAGESMIIIQYQSRDSTTSLYLEFYFLSRVTPSSKGMFVLTCV